MFKSDIPRTMAFSYHLDLFVKARWLFVIASFFILGIAKLYFEIDSHG